MLRYRLTIVLNLLAKVKKIETSPFRVCTLRFNFPEGMLLCRRDKKTV